MGIRFIDSVLSLLTAACVVFSSYFVGHALSSDHAGWAWITAAVLGALGLLLGLFTVRRIRSFAARHDDASHRGHAH